jgi:hypothetical protein
MTISDLTQGREFTKLVSARGTRLRRGRDVSRVRVLSGLASSCGGRTRVCKWRRDIGNVGAHRLSRGRLPNAQLPCTSNRRHRSSSAGRPRTGAVWVRKRFGSKIFLWPSHERSRRDCGDGLERASVTLGLKGRCSIQLSYGRGREKENLHCLTAHSAGARDR